MRSSIGACSGSPFTFSISVGVDGKTERIHELPGAGYAACPVYFCLRRWAGVPAVAEGHSPEMVGVLMEGIIVLAVLLGLAAVVGLERALPNRKAPGALKPRINKPAPKKSPAKHGSENSASANNIVAEDGKPADQPRDHQSANVLKPGKARPGYGGMCRKIRATPGLASLCARRPTRPAVGMKESLRRGRTKKR